MHPILYLVFQLILTVFITGFTQPDSRLRPIGLVGSTLCVVQCIPLCMTYMVRVPWAALVGGYSVTHLYHYLDIVLLSRWSFLHNAPVSGLVRPSPSPKSNDEVPAENKKATGEDTFLARLLFGLKLTASFRFVGTLYEVRNTPRAVIVKRGDRTYFLWRTFATIAISYAFLDAISVMNDPAIASKYLDLDKIPLLFRLHEVTAEEILVRAFTVLAAGIGLNCVQGGLYNVFALLGVAIHVSEPKDWPPFYGSPQDAYTLTSFWNVFWHQINARKFSSISHYTVHQLFHLPRGTLVARYLRILVAFLSSGVMHLIDDFASGIRFGNSGAMRFFLTQGLGMVVEDIIIKFYHSSTITMPRLMEKSIGYLWVSLFLIWSVPAYMYPIMWRANLGLNDSTVPFSFFESSAERVKAFTCLLCAVAVGLCGSLFS
ncbi:hypothetical protein K458DRAFT_482614 [Lentithecium fluviatile CBS 122367]|uniref:Wax synthase domain-containing protein n=1 Tax=Lentithecium fluviatile CBS 122367 TaxID=1168545 RepID=A0A6G1JP19_9PLEO|nr:hypothetical protein K458DRAFT_482614 [Lentithecium fluviatile CBS 122367]